MLSHSVVFQLFATPWTVAHQAPLSLRFYRQEHWSGLPLPSPGDLPHPWIKSDFPALAGMFFTTGATWEASVFLQCSFIKRIPSLDIKGNFQPRGLSSLLLSLYSWSCPLKVTCFLNLCETLLLPTHLFCEQLYFFFKTQ